MLPIFFFAEKPKKRRRVGFAEEFISRALHLWATGSVLTRGVINITSPHELGPAAARAPRVREGRPRERCTVDAREHEDVPCTHSRQRRTPLSGALCPRCAVPDKSVHAHDTNHTRRRARTDHHVRPRGRGGLNARSAAGEGTRPLPWHSPVAGVVDAAGEDPPRHTQL